MRPIYYFIIAACIFIESFFMVQYTMEGRDNENWTGPYLSAAANLHLGGTFRINLGEVNYFKEISVHDQYNYRFTNHENLTHYNHNPIGFAYIIAGAHGIFPFTGQVNGLLILQVLMHTLLCLLLLHRSQNKTFCLLFTMVYALNPLVINFVVLNYYYFWQCIPGFIIIYYLLQGERKLWIAALFTLLITISTLARPTLLFLSLFSLLMYFKWFTPRFAVINILIATTLFFIINKPIEKNIWHTIYVGIAAYPNGHISHLSDDEAYQLYEEKTGVKLNASVGGNYYNYEVIELYQQITHDEVVSIFHDHPWYFFRNAMLNGFQCYSPGYLNNQPVWLNICSAICGLIFMTLLWVTRQRFIILCIALYAGSFCLYYPPIQAYLFGAYVLLAFGLYNILSNYFGKHFPPPKTQYPL